jgi:hypothetical protein
VPTKGGLPSKMAINGLYNHGLPFSACLAQSLIRIKQRVLENNKAGMIIIDGGVGEGKTTLMTEVADYIGGQPIVFSEQLAKGGQHFLEILRHCFKNGYVVCCYDEAGDFNRRLALTSFNNTLNRVFEIYRAFKIIIILALPCFDDLDFNMFKKEIPRFLLHVESRGKNSGNFRGYSLYRMYYLKRYMKLLTVKTQSYSMVEPNIYGHFLDLPSERRQELEKYSIEGKLNILEEEEHKKSTQELFSFQDLAEILGFSNTMIRIMIARQHLQPVKKVGNCLYFNREHLEKLKINKEYNEKILAVR